MDHQSQASPGCAPLRSLGIRLCALAVAVTNLAGGCTSARHIEPEAGGSYSQTVLEALEPGQEVIVTRADASAIAGRVAGFDGQLLVVENGQGSFALQVEAIATLKVREFSRAKTAAASGAVTFGVLIAIMVSSIFAMFDGVIQ